MDGKGTCQWHVNAGGVGAGEWQWAWWRRGLGCPFLAAWFWESGGHKGGTVWGGVECHEWLCERLWWGGGCGAGRVDEYRRIVEHCL